MNFSKRFLKKIVSAIFVFNSCLFAGSDFIFQNSVSAHTMSAKELFKGLMYQINSNGGYTGTGMPFGFSNGEECVYIPCGNGTNTIVPKRITERISRRFDMCFHDLVSKYSLIPDSYSYPYTEPVQSQFQYPTQEQFMMPAPPPVVMPAPPVEYSTPPAPPAVIPASPQFQYSVPPKYIPPSVDIL